MKKLLFLAATLLLVISCKVTDPNEPDDSNTSVKDSGVCGDNLTWTLTDDGVLTISGTGDMYDYAPDDEEYDEVYTPWASDENFNTTINEIKIQNGVTSIGNYAFLNCVNLKSITIPNTITKIGLGAFYNCNNLTSVTIPNGVTSIKYGAFYLCNSLTSITIPNSVKSIGGDLFYDCSDLTTITVEEGNTVYDSRNNCNAIIETATNTLIEGCMNTIIPNSVTSIGESAFRGCSGLTGIAIPNSVTSIGNSAFEDCGDLTSVTIGNSVTSIGEYAFYWCSSLTSVTIGSSVTIIGDRAFSGCNNLSSIYNYASVPQEIRYSTFEGVNTDICILYVPKESVELYKEAEVWQDFQQIVGIDVPED